MWFKFYNCFNELCRVRLSLLKEVKLKIFKKEKIYLLIDKYTDNEWENIVYKDVTDYNLKEELVEKLNDYDYKIELINLAKEQFDNKKRKIKERLY